MYNYAYNYISFVCTVSIIIIVIYQNKDFDLTLIWFIPGQTGLNKKDKDITNFIS